MSDAKTYIYRNLNTGGFSAKYKGVVVARFGTSRYNAMVTINPEFRVSQKVSARVKAKGQRAVHAYIVCDGFASSSYCPPMDIVCLPTIKYNPFTDTEFSLSDGDISKCEGVVFCDGKAYAITDEAKKVAPSTYQWYMKLVHVLQTV